MAAFQEDTVENVKFQGVLPPPPPSSTGAFEEKCSAILQRLEHDLRNEPSEHKLPQGETSAQGLPERGPSQRTSISAKCGASHISSTHSRSSSASSILMKQKAKVEGARAKLESTALEVQMKKEKMELKARLSMLAAKRDAEEAGKDVQYISKVEETTTKECLNFNDPNSGQPTNFTETNHGQHINFTETNHGQHIDITETNNGQHKYFAETEQISKLPARINVSSQPIGTQGIIDSGNNPTQMIDLCAQFAKFMVKKDLLLSRLTAFNDSPELFASWKATFQNIASEMEVSATEEIDLLIKWLGPESSRQAQALRAAKAGDPRSCLKTIWDRLNERFGSHEMVRAAIDKRLVNFQRIGKDLHKLYDLADLVTEINALKDDPRYSTLLAYYDSPSGVKPIVNKLPISLKEKWTTEATRYKKKWEVLYPPFSYFAMFIRDLAVVRNDPSFTYDNSTTDTKKDEGTSGNARTKTARPNITVRKTETKETSASQTLCPIHNTKHSLNQCRPFRIQPIGERKDLLFKKGLCFRCCGMEKHLARDCTASVRCELCNVTDHPTALHVSSQDDSTTTTKQPPRKKAWVSKSHGGESSGKETTPTDIKTSCTQICGNPVATSKSCGKIVMAKLYPKGKHQQALTVYVIIDDQSNRTLGRSCIFDHFEEDSPALEYSMSSCAGTRIDIGRRLSNYTIESMDGSFKTRLPEVIECNGIPDVREEIPTPEVTKHYKHLNNLTNLIQPVKDEVMISLLIGRDLPEVHHIMDQRTGKAGSPFAQKLRLGLVVVGETCLGAIHKTENVNVNKLNTLANGRPTCLHPCHNKMEVNDESPIFFKSPDENKPGLSVRDRKFLQIMETEFMKNEEGSWTAPLPFIEPRERLPNNREAALKRARSLEISMKRNSKKKEDMFTFMGGIIEKGHAEVAPSTPEEQEKWYLPLFGIYHPRKPNKIRGVFDSSAKFKGVSLNDSLLTGPNMTNNLVEVLLRFRKGSVAVAADVEHMFYCFVVRPEHREFLRFFWYKDNDFEKQLMEYRMTRHVFRKWIVTSHSHLRTSESNRRGR
ncbi:uncharacterized protein [Argopecten irradians]|uniref:uncharacterized protein n=1 Tax=Argopecten irradians TaxID=31199 RepID=UPI003710E5FA